MSDNMNSEGEGHPYRSSRKKSRNQSVTSDVSLRSGVSGNVDPTKRRSEEGIRPHYQKKSPPRSRPVSATSADSQHSVYDEIPHDYVPSRGRNQAKISNNNRRPNSAGSNSELTSTRQPCGVNPAISMRPGGSPRHSALQKDSSTASPDMVDLNMSSVSQGSGASVVTLGGVEYPVGARIGKTGMFVIGDPAAFSRHDITSFHSSVPSIVSSSAPLYHSDGIGYGFESWNWSAIRFALFMILCLIMVALLATVITLAIGQQDSCVVQFEWWKGSTFYSLSVPHFYNADNIKYGNLLGVERKIDYLEFMAIGALVMRNFFPGKVNQWDLVMSFTEVDPRLGTLADFQSLIANLQKKDIKLLIQICPWFTSTDHVWYQQSRESSMNSNEKYADFYIWSDEPDPKIIGKWEYDDIRSQYYLYYTEAAKPVINWNNMKVRTAFNEVIDLWLQRGVDGFVLCELNNFYTEDFDFLQQFYATLAKYSLGDNNRKVLAVDSDFIAETARLNYPLYEDYLGIRDPTTRTVDLIMTPFYMEQNGQVTKLVSAVNKALEWQAHEDGPWVLWSLSQLSQTDVKYVTALSLLELMLPGTPMYTAGQEIGLYFDEYSGKYMPPMMWMPDSAVPSNPGSNLSPDHVWAVRNISTARRNVFSFRFDRVIDQDDEGFNYRILELNELESFILLCRYYTSDKTYYFAGNFGENVIKRDLQQAIAPWATVLVDSGSRYFGRLELKQVVLNPGQVVVFYPTK